MAKRKKKAKKKKRKKKIPLKRYERKADKALSEYIREKTRQEYGKCPICGEGEIQCCFHFISRRRKIVRWDATNVIGACHTCNWQERYFPDLSRAWFIKTYGVEVYLNLVEKSKGKFQPLPDYLKLITKYYQHRRLDILETKT